MDEKSIRSFSLATLLKINPLQEGDLCYDGCVIANRVLSKEEKTVDLFRYPSRIDAFGIAFCSKGSITVKADLTPYVIGERTMFVYPGGAILQVVSEQEAEMQLILCEEEFVNRVNIDLKLLSRLFLAVRENPCLPLGKEEWSEISRALEELFEEGRARREDAISVEIMRMLFRTTAYRVCRVIDRRIERQSGGGPVSRNRNDEHFKAFIDSLSANYIRERSVGFYADLLHLTPKYLTTVIRLTTGRTAAEWIDDYVVLEAKNLLKYSTMSIQEIAYALNFPNQSFFGKYFKNHTGLTPSAYRAGK